MIRLRCVLSAICGMIALLGAPARAETTLTLGDITLQACGSPDHAVFCGEFQRALNPDAPDGAQITLRFEWWPHLASGTSAGTLVALEGGPGFSTTDSRTGFLDLYGDLRQSRDLLLMDVRGTGQSDVLDCPALALAPGLPAKEVAKCGRQNAGKVSYLGSAPAMDDLAALITAMNLDPVDLYGYSYGTFLAQSFAARHGELLRSLVLDSAYPANSLSPWYQSTFATMAKGLNTACARDRTCADRSDAGNRDAGMARLTALVTALRAKPITANALAIDGTPIKVLLNPSSIHGVLVHTSAGPVVLREFDAAARAYLDNADPVPLARLVAEAADMGDPQAGYPDAAVYSDALFVAVSCLDYPQLYDMAAAPDQRRVAYDRAIAMQTALAPDAYAPFTLSEVLASTFYENQLALCLNWPALAPLRLADRAVPQDAKMPDVPTLVLSGEFDALTPPEDAAAVAAMFAHATHVVVANEFHIVAAYSVGDCTKGMVQRFVATLKAGDTSCAALHPAIAMIPEFPQRFDDVAPAQVQDASVPRSDRINAAIAVLTARDALARWYVTLDGARSGLRGGAIMFEGDNDLVLVRLDAVELVPDAAVSGTLIWNRADGSVAAVLSLDETSLTARWDDNSHDPETIVIAPPDELVIRDGRE